MLNRIFRPLLIAGFLATLTVAVEAKPLTPAALEAWLARYGAAWEGLDPKLAGSLFTEDAIYQENPYEDPWKGRAGVEKYWRTETADHSDVHFESKVVAVDGNIGVAQWTAEFTLKSNGVIIEIDGVFVLEFDANGQCSSLREWWHVRNNQ
jgi:limonene-1,2-epoxide hydrolase